MRQLSWFLAGAAFWVGLAEASDTVRYAPPPAWVVVDPADELPATPPGDVSYGYDYLLLDNQVSIRDQENYVHHVYRVTAEGALQSASRVTLSFDPGYSELTMHHLRVIRDGHAEDRLKSTPVKVIQQERDLDRHLLNGELTALYVLEDIRVGDVIDYAFTRRGWNPVLERRYFARVTTAWAVPVRRQRFRLIAPPGRVPATQSHGPGHSEPTRSKLGDDEVLTWTATNSEPIPEEKETPDWFEAYPAIQLSEFTTWAQVVRWAEPLYALPDPLPESVRAQAEKLTRGLESDEAKALALLHFVQQEIRYLGMELGAGSYRPTPPADVLARRFGDCKDKTMLFCALARAAGLTAHPALLHTTFGEHIKTWLPTPLAFDHVIAVLTDPNGKEHWVDPTLTNQQGGLATRGLPDYGCALIVRAGNDRLSPVHPPPTARSSVKYLETFDVPGFDQPARLNVRTMYTGLSADAIRRDFAQNTPAELGKSYLNYYASIYPGLTATAPPRLNEHAGENEVFVDENYSVTNLWTLNATEKKLVAEFYPKPILDVAVRPVTTVRTTPLAVAFPSNAELTTVVNLPEVWSIKPGEHVMESDGFRGTIGIRGNGRVVVMTYRFETKADQVAANRVALHVEALNRFRNALGYTLTYRKPAAQAAPGAPAFRLNWMLVLVSLVTLTLAGAAIRAIETRFPPQPPLPPPVDSTLVGIGGWLYLVAVGLTVTPIRLFIVTILKPRPSYNQFVWDAITTSGSVSYQAGLGPLILAEIAGNLLLFALTVWQLTLFCRRRQLFPTVYIMTLSFAILLAVGDAVAGHLIIEHTATTAAKTYAEIVSMVIAACIWIPYMLVSRRVKQTFTK